MQFFQGESSGAGSSEDDNPAEMTVAVLQQRLRLLQLPTSGRKSDLVLRLGAALASGRSKTKVKSELVPVGLTQVRPGTSGIADVQSAEVRSKKNKV